MLFVQWKHAAPVAPVPIPLPNPLPISTIVSHRFGDLTWFDVSQGTYWRLITATFIHFGLLHLVLNLFALLTLGRLLEPGYRTGPFLAICLAIGGLGNLVGAGLRHLMTLIHPWLTDRVMALPIPNWLQQFLVGGQAASDHVHSGGGSTILLGLLSLAAVIGWRSRTRIGHHLYRQMVLFLGITAVLGVVLHQLIDNYGHIGGAIVGACFGLFNRRIRVLRRARAWRVASWSFVAAVLITSVCMVVASDRQEQRKGYLILQAHQRMHLDRTLLLDLEQLFQRFVKQIQQSPMINNEGFELDLLAIIELLRDGPRLNLTRPLSAELAAQERKELELLVARLDQYPADTWGPTTSDDLKTLRSLARNCLDRPVAYADVYAFLVAWRPAARAVAADLTQWEQRARLIEQGVTRPAP